MSGGANCPETPRQKMIGMMYLFLTAMLAINVSKTILNAFVVVNHSLEKTNKTFDAKNDYMYNLLAQAKLNDPKAYPYYEASLKVQKLAKEMNDYILKDRAELLHHVISDVPLEKLKTYPLKEVEAKDNYDIPTHYFLGQSVDGSQGEARKLKNKLIEYKKQLIDLLKDPKIVLPNKEEKIAKLGDLGIDTDDPEEKNPDNPEENYWETAKFDHTPIAAAVAILSQIQNQVKNAEATILNKLLGGIGSTDFKFDTLAAKAIPKTNYVIQGGEYEADLFVAAFSKSSKPTVWIGERIDTVNGEIKISGNPFGNNGQPDTIPVINGMGKLKIPANSTGLKKYAALIEVKNSSTGEVKKYPLILDGQPYAEFTVAKPSATISPTKMNVLYIGVDNPIDISVSGFPDSKVNAVLSGGGGYLRKKAPGKYIARVKKATKAGATISVSVKDDNGKSRSMGRMKFRVKPIPDPVATIGGKQQGSMSRNELLLQGKVKATLKNFAFDLKFKIISYTVSATIGGFESDAKCTGSRLSPKAKSLIKKVRRGQRVVFTNVKAKGPDGKVRTLNGIIIKIK